MRIAEYQTMIVPDNNVGKQFAEESILNDAE